MRETEPGHWGPDGGEGRIIALYLDLAREVDFYAGTVGLQDVYAALDRSRLDDMGQADAWMQQADGTIRAFAHDWELTPLTEEDGSMVKIDAARAFHDAPKLFAAVWWARREEREEEPGDGR